MALRTGEHRRPAAVRGMAASPVRWGPGQHPWRKGPKGSNKVWHQGHADDHRRWGAWTPEGVPAAPPGRPRRARGGGRIGGVGRGIPFLIWPGYCVSRLLGLLPLRYVPRENLSVTTDDWLSFSRIWLPLCLGLAAASAYGLWFQGNQFAVVVLNPKTTLSNYVYEVPMLLNTVIALVCTAFSLSGSRNMAMSWRAALTTLAELDAVNRSPSSTSRRCRPLESWLFFVLVWFNMAMVALTHQLYTSSHDYITQPWESAAVMLVRFVPLAVESQYLLSCLLLQRAYRSLTTSFRDLARGFFPSDQAESVVDGPLGGPLGSALGDGGQMGAPAVALWGPSKLTWAPGGAQGLGQGGPRLALLSRLRVLHQRVFQQVEALTAHFGPQLLCKLVQTRIQLITDAFALVRVLQAGTSDEDDKLAFYAIEVCFLAYRLFVVVYRSEKVLQQDQVLVQLVCLVDPTTWDHASNQQLQLFRRQVRSLRAELHTCSMFTLNYDLLLAVAATTTTYLVVLVQFQPKGSSS